MKVIWHSVLQDCLSLVARSRSSLQSLLRRIFNPYLQLVLQKSLIWLSRLMSTRLSSAGVLPPVIIRLLPGYNSKHFACNHRSDHLFSTLHKHHVTKIRICIHICFSFHRQPLMRLRMRRNLPTNTSLDHNYLCYMTSYQLG